MYTKMHRRFSIGDVYHDYDFRAVSIRALQLFSIISCILFLFSMCNVYVLAIIYYCSVYFTQNAVFNLNFAFIESIRPLECAHDFRLFGKFSA